MLLVVFIYMHLHTHLYICLLFTVIFNFTNQANAKLCFDFDCLLKKRNNFINNNELVK